ncbi:MAG: ClC family H(+)/Cl(-) exchange transporter [Ruminococcaceae bacterium]|nr:ClC family H(+)/Cl(-) exchange transporter [Oscillospiraceae bacterium]
MRNQEKSTIRKVGFHKSESIYLIIRGLEVGIASGLVCVLYRFALKYAEEGLMLTLDYVKSSPVRIALWLALLCVLGVLVSYINKWEPDAAGSGIPQTSGEIRGYFSLNWWRVIIAKFIGGTTSVFSGLSLGREGPSVQLGGMAAKGVAKATKSDKTTELRMISCGAGAGMAAAFNAPIAGTMFVLEEIHHSLDKSMLCMSIVASITADYISIAFFGHQTTFNYDTVTLALHHYWILVLMGLVLGVAGAFYNVFMVTAQKLFKKITKIPQPVKFAFVFLVSGIVGLTIPQIVCGGHSMAETLMTKRPELTVLAFLLVAKFLFGAFSFASGAPGGTLYPLCVLGAYIGAIFGNIAINNIGIRGGLYEEFVVIGMAGLFSSIVRAPLTGIILVFELTGDMHSLLPIATVSLIAYAVANTIGTAPFYSILFEKAVENTDSPVINTKETEKVIQTFVIPVGSSVAGKTIADIDWGKHCVIVSVERGETPITPKGDTELKEGDTLVILISQRRFSQDVQRICDMIKK